MANIGRRQPHYFCCEQTSPSGKVSLTVSLLTARQPGAYAP